MRPLDAEHLAARVRMGVEMDEPERAVPCRQRLDLGLRHRVISTQHDWHHACIHHFAHDALDGRVTRDWVCRDHGRIAVINDPQLPEGVDPGFEMRSRRTARRPDRSRPEARPRTIRDEIVHRRTHDGHVHTGQLGGILGVRRAAVGEQPSVVRLVAQRLPARERVDHPRIIPRPPR